MRTEEVGVGLGQLFDPRIMVVGRSEIGKGPHGRRGIGVKEGEEGVAHKRYTQTNIHQLYLGSSVSHRLASSLNQSVPKDQYSHYLEEPVRGHQFYSSEESSAKF